LAHRGAACLKAAARLRRWIDHLSFISRVILAVMVVLVTIAVIAWDLIDD
jgi:hypothetical protein